MALLVVPTEAEQVHACSGGHSLTLEVRLVDRGEHVEQQRGVELGLERETVWKQQNYHTMMSGFEESLVEGPPVVIGK
jgi:hypothetical protein